MVATPKAIPIGIAEIEEAQRVLQSENPPVALRTPLVFSDVLSRQLGCRVWLKARESPENRFLQDPRRVQQPRQSRT